MKKTLQRKGMIKMPISIEDIKQTIIGEDITFLTFNNDDSDIFKSEELIFIITYFANRGFESNKIKKFIYLVSKLAINSPLSIEDCCDILCYYSSMKLNKK